MKYYKLLVLLALGVITAFSLFKYINSLEEKYKLLSSLEQARNRMSIIESEKLDLSRQIDQVKKSEQVALQENAGLKISLKANEDRIVKLESGFRDLQQSIEKMSSVNSALTAENMSLREQRDNLDIQVYRLSGELENYKARLSSVPELRKLIREIRRSQSRPAREISAGAAAGIAEGNSGFLVKEGQPTYSSKVRIDVEPAGAN